MGDSGMLQWGRDQVVAEMRDPLRADGRGARFNGAATKWSRKCAAIDLPVFGSPCFNGAATKWSRKSPNLKSYGLVVHASMGPRPSGRGNGA